MESFITLLVLCSIILYIVMFKVEPVDKNIETEESVWQEKTNINTELIETEVVETSETEIMEMQNTKVETESIEVTEETIVRVKTYIPNIAVELKYTSVDNFTGQKIYDFEEAYLRYGTVKKLMKVQSALREKGLLLKIWDAFRPTSAQFVLWEICPEPTYVANPHKGFSSHSRGNTVDITIVDEFGKELLMPTAFDDFSKLADRDYSDCTEKARENALLLENIMKENGFKGYSGEWWHYTDEDVYSVEKEFEP